MKTTICLALLCAASVQAATYAPSRTSFNSGLARTQTGAVRHCGVLGPWVRQPQQSANYLNQSGPFPIPAPMPAAPVTAPTLSIRLVGTDIRVSWPLAASSFVLLENGDPADPLAWMKVADPYQTDAEENFVLISPAQPMRFYRLVYSP
jgi:hypothetical protein